MYNIESVCVQRLISRFGITCLPLGVYRCLEPLNDIENL